MARPRYPRSNEPLPPPLPPETRTVGQLVAETLRLYGARFWPSLALGLGIAALDQVSLDRSVNVQMVVLWAFSPLLTLSYVGASALVGRVRPTPRSALVALAAGLIVFLPVPLLVRAFVLPAVAWLGAVGLAVPAAVLERTGLRASLARGFELGRADFLHAVGSLATLVIVYVLTRIMLAYFLRGFGDAADRVAAFLADLVLSPVLFLGAALLYSDQAARVGGYARPSASHSRR